MDDVRNRYCCPVRDYRPRLVDPLIESLMREVPGILLVGPRATGKTTTAARRAATEVPQAGEAQVVETV